MQQSLDIALKGVKAVFIYNMLREGVPKSNGTWEKGIQVVITSGVRDKVGQGMLIIDIEQGFLFAELFPLWRKANSISLSLLHRARKT